MKNALWYLGFLSLLSLLYLKEGKTAFLWSLGFIPYFSLYRVSDERLEALVGKATRNAFMYTMGSGAAIIVYIYLFGTTEFFPIAFVLMFGGTLLICITSLLYYHTKGENVR
jgi:hypothetical protein